MAAAEESQILDTVNENSSLGDAVHKWTVPAAFGFGAGIGAGVGVGMGVSRVLSFALSSSSSSRSGLKSGLTVGLAVTIGIGVGVGSALLVRRIQKKSEESQASSTKDIMEKWMECAQIVQNIADELKTQLESKSEVDENESSLIVEIGKQKYPLPLNIALLDILDKCRLEKTKASEKDVTMTVNDEMFSDTRADASRFLRYASAVYGVSVLMALGEWSGKDPLPSLIGASTEEVDRQTLATFCHIKAIDVLDTSKMSVPTLSMPCHAILVDHESKSLVLAIRGTASVTDGLVHDLVCNDVPFAGGKAHSGMAQAAYAMMESVIDDLIGARNQSFPTYKIVITGHSLGAGVACLLSILLLKSMKLKDSELRCFAFAPPPVFEGPISNNINNTILSFANIDDIVPHLCLYKVEKALKRLLQLDSDPVDAYTRLSIILGFQEPSETLLQATDTNSSLDLGSRVSLHRGKSVFPKLQVPGVIHILNNNGGVFKIDSKDFVETDIPMGTNAISEHLVNAYSSKIIT